MDDEPPSTSDASATTAETRFFTAATWNVNSVRARMGALTSFLKAEAPDVVCLQEIKVQKEAFPFSETAALGYSALICAQKAYNGVAVLSKQKAQIVRNVLPKAPDNGEQARFIDVVLPNGIRIVSVYVPNGEAPANAPLSTERLTYKIGWLHALADYAADLAVKGEKFFLAGDFNVIDSAANVYDFEKFKNSVFMRPEVRGAFRRFAYAGLTDAVRLYARSEERRVGKEC